MGKYDGRSRDQKQDTAQIAVKLSYPLRASGWFCMH